MLALLFVCAAPARHIWTLQLVASSKPINPETSLYGVEGHSCSPEDKEEEEEEEEAAPVAQLF